MPKGLGIFVVLVDERVHSYFEDEEEAVSNAVSLAKESVFNRSVEVAQLLGSVQVVTETHFEKWS
jgi:hypothetical protein